MATQLICVAEPANLVGFATGPAGSVSHTTPQKSFKYSRVAVERVKIPNCDTLQHYRVDDKEASLEERRLLKVI